MRRVVVAYVSITWTPFRNSIVPPGEPTTIRGLITFVRSVEAGLQQDATRRVLMGAPTYPPRVRSIALTDVLARVEADSEEALEVLKEYVRLLTISGPKRPQPEAAFRLLRGREQGDLGRGRRDDRGRRSPPRGHAEDRARMQRHPLRRDEQPHRESGPALVVRGDRAEPCVAADPRAHDVARREGSNQDRRLVHGRAAPERPRVAVPARERLQGGGPQRVLGRLRIHRWRERFRAAPAPDLFPDLHDLRLREWVHRAGHEDREPRGRESEDRLPPGPEHEAGGATCETAGASDFEGVRRHRALSREGVP